MIDNFDDFCLLVFCIVDDLCIELKPWLKRPGPPPKCSDSELIAMTIIGECKGWDIETNMLSNFRSYRHLFPELPSQSRYNRRRRNLMWVMNQLRRIVLSRLEWAQDQQCVIDSLPIPVVGFHLVPASTGDWSAYEARFGKVSSKKMTMFGYKLHLLVTVNGLIIDFMLAPANETDLEAGLDILSDHTDLKVLGDKAYISAEKTEELERTNRVRLETLPRKNQKKQLPKSTRKLFNRVRQIIETVNGQLVDQFNIETNHAHTFGGLCTRLYAKLTAHTFCIYLNHWLGNKNCLQMKHLAFPS